LEGMDPFYIDIDGFWPKPQSTGQLGVFRGVSTWKGAL
jgi:hypothetical protein